MKRTVLTAALLTAIAGGGFALAQAPTPDDHAAHHGGMMGNGVGNGMMGDGMCPMSPMSQMMGGLGSLGMMMGGPKTKVDVKKTEKGVTITLTAPDAATAARLQKMAEGMRLMHDAMAQ